MYSQQPFQKPSEKPCKILILSVRNSFWDSSIPVFAGEPFSFSRIVETHRLQA
jgi:hypothetical protein